MGRSRRRWVSIGRWDGQGPRWLVAVIWVAFVRAGCAAVYLNKWAVEVAGGSDDADRIAAEYGFRNLGQVIDCLLECYVRSANIFLINSAKILLFIFIYLQSEFLIDWLFSKLDGSRVSLASGFVMLHAS